ncbi:MAG TPA: endolytic transglycosylase MltG [Patescibacteria group bacterium]
MKKKLTLIPALILVLLVGGAIFVSYQLRAPNTNKGTQRFIIEKGSSGAAIANKLEKQGIIRNGLVFRLYTKFTGVATRIQSGEYELSSNLTVPVLVATLLKGPTEVWVTVPEGLRREEVVQTLIEDMKLTGTRASTFSSDFLNGTIGKEGYLFPDTYLISLDANANSVIKVMESTFEKKYADASKTQTASLNREQAVILASIIQREAITAEDMKGVASVLENRLAIGMALGSDVTVEYGLGYDPVEKTWWKKDLTADDLAINSPYNTRINAGLPPTPISNPGLVALEAALNPPQTNYLYYLSDSDGKLHFATTLEEHNANIQKYLQ